MEKIFFLCEFLIEDHNTTVYDETHFNLDLNLCHFRLNVLTVDCVDFFSYIFSPLNYIGGKGRLLSQILPLFPDKIETFVDLFCGGCNVGINVSAQRVVFNDNLSFLIELYKAFLDLSEKEVLQHIEMRIDMFALSLTNKDGYLKLRRLYNTEKNPLDLFVLTAFSFNHQIRFNNSHEFNNPFGKERSCFNPRMHKKLLDFLAAIKRKPIEFSCLNFDEFDFSRLSENDFIYADPPYLITTGTYNDGRRGFTGWNELHERKLLEILAAANARGIRFALSNVLMHKGKSNDILKRWVQEKRFFIHRLNNNYSNSNYHTRNRKSDSTEEVLITNYANRIFSH